MNLSQQSIEKLKRTVSAAQDSRESSGRQQTGKTDDPVELADFEVTAEYADYLAAEFVATLDADGNAVAQEGAETIYIAKPYLIRSKPFDAKTVGGISYITKDQTTREATQDSETEIQTITPSYIARAGSTPGEIITAIKCNTGMSTGSGESLKAIDWLDLNTGGRCWALNEDWKESEQSIPGASSVPSPSTIP
jgi:hypothetical protein